ncbi:RNA-directed DNA polymerase [Actinospica durhamensis]|uniref:RNA-directed DNA polymerase n=1 Tax=Actinospica durhamensis TaxID=1508375 RepID=A0A941ESC2_9ACTN|nr:RNA-directed DNA polymerase [Actinospica durhamensis]MBR7836166.1 RNA-directed DNA polymerase [Actinospica durhamensis]
MAHGAAVTSVRNLLADTVDDWFADPWGYPELSGPRPRGARPAPEPGPVTPPAQMLIPKTPAAAWSGGSGGMRTAVFLLPADRLRYQAAADALAPHLRPARPAPSFGWRAQRPGTAAGRYRDQRAEWAECLRLLRGHAERFGHLVFLDIADFFASIRRDLLNQALSRALDRARESARGPFGPASGGRDLGVEFDALFEAFFSPRLAHPGLPQNHQPSSVLANAYVDAALADLEVPSRHAAVVRWMDDLWVFGRTAAAAAQAHEQVGAHLAAWGLRLNDGKTQTYQGPLVGAAVEETTVRTSGRYRAYQVSASCLRVDEEWLRISHHADPRAADSLRARLLYGHACRDQRHHADLTEHLTAVVRDPGAAPAGFQPAAWWLARRETRTARELLTAVLPELSDPYLTRACVLAARDAGAEPRAGSAPGQGVADPAQAARQYAAVAPVRHRLAYQHTDGGAAAMTHEQPRPREREELGARPEALWRAGQVAAGAE